MSANSELVVRNSLLEHFRCCLCEGYLSSSPVRVLPEGTCICGHCSVLDTPVYRVPALEAVLTRTLFPCRFKQHGCEESVQFDRAFEHESKCTCRFFACPMVPQTACVWKGASSKLLDHIVDKHSSFYVQGAEFNVQVDQDSQGTLLVLRPHAFVVKYEYSARNRNLRYIIRHCENKAVHDIAYNIKLISKPDGECSVILKTNKCLQFDDNFHGMRNPSVLNLNKFLQCLDNPDCILITFNLQVRNNTDVDARSNKQVIDYNLLNSLRCHKCHEYLMLPLFNLDGSIICSDCAKNNPDSTPTSDEQLEKRIIETSYPCRWRDCAFIGNSGNIKGHEQDCQFRIYNCLFKGCHITFKLTSAIAHFQCHRSLHVVNSLAYTTSFRECYDFKHVFTIRGSMIISVEHSVVRSGNRLVHHVSLHSSSSSKVSANLNFEHAHCKLKSNVSALETGTELTITLDDLPHCFKAHEPLTVTVEL